MLKLNVNVPTDLSELSRRIQDKVRANPELMAAVGSAAEMTLRSHFETLNRRPNKRGFHKTNFWAKIESATSMTSSSAKTATVTIADDRFGAKVSGAVITPKSGKALAIPLTDEAYGKWPAQWDKAALQLIPRKGKPPILATIDDNDEIRAQYVLLRRVTTPADPDALPSEHSFWEHVLDEADEYFKSMEL